MCVCARVFVCVRRAEWQWLQAVRSIEEAQEMAADEQSAPHRLLQDLRCAARELLSHMNISKKQVCTPAEHNGALCHWGSSPAVLRRTHTTLALCRCSLHC